MKKLHFRRFFRPTTTTRGGSTAGPPPEHHHIGRRFPCSSCTHVHCRSHIHSASHMPSYTPLPTYTSTNHFFPFLSHHPLILPPHSTKQTLEADQSIPDHSHSFSFSYSRAARNPRENHPVFSRPSLQKHTQTSNPPGRHTGRPDVRIRLPVLFFVFHHLPLPISLPSLHEISSTHPIHYNHTLFTTIPRTYLHHKLSFIKRSKESEAKHLLELGGEEKSKEEACTYLWSHQGAVGYDP